MQQQEEDLQDDGEREQDDLLANGHLEVVVGLHVLAGALAALGIERVALGLGPLDAQALELGLLRGVCLGTLTGGLLGTQAPELLALLVGQGCLVCHGCSSCLPHGAWFGWLGSRPLV